MTELVASSAFCRERIVGTYLPIIAHIMLIIIQQRFYNALIEPP